LADERDPSEKAQAEAGDCAPADALAIEEPAEDDDPYGCRGGKESRVGHGRVEDGEVPEDEVARKQKAGRNDRPREPRQAIGDGGTRFFRAHPGIEQG
jgi:hypothetical protein